MTTPTITTAVFKQLGNLKNVKLIVEADSPYGKKWKSSQKETYHDYLKHLAARELDPRAEWREAAGSPGIPSRIHGDAKSKYPIDKQVLTWWVSFGNGKAGGPPHRRYTLLHGNGEHRTNGDTVLTATFESESIDQKTSVLDLKSFKTELKAAFEALKLKDGIFEPEL